MSSTWRRRCATGSPAPDGSAGHRGSLAPADGGKRRCEREARMSLTEQSSVYALLVNGNTVEIRPARPGDYDAVKAMHEAMSPDNAYLRFFSLSRQVAETEAHRICRPPGPGRAALLALDGAEVVGVASYEALDGQDTDHKEAEIAFAVADRMHHRGIATLLLEHLVWYARSHGVTTFTGLTLGENTAMLKVIADA